MKYLANSKQEQDLKSHLLGVMKMSMFCAEHLGVDEELKNLCGVAGFLHDIGKVSDNFQNFTLKDIRSEKIHPRHNEVSWLYTHYRAEKGDFKKIVPQAVYWHHGTYFSDYDILDGKNQRNSSIIEKELSSYNNNELITIFQRIDDIISSTEFPFDINKYIAKDNDDAETIIPRLFEKEKGAGDKINNSKRIIVRSCVIYSDYFISSMTSEEVDDFISNASYSDIFKNNTCNNKDILCPPKYDVKRFELQKNIVNECKRTSIVKAPAGFGKSLIGVLWGLRYTNQTYWVCPRNTVAEGVYNNILDVIEDLGLDISVELYLTSERKKCNNPDIKECQSNIVVTNIDNLLSPMVNQKHSGRLFDVNIGNVVFDEFHEFVNSEGLFGAFITYMRARKNLCKNVNTLLLSATPSILNMLWDFGDCKTQLLPSKEEHYPAQHDEKYKIIFENDFVSNPTDKSLTMYTSIYNVQDQFKNGYTDIIHSKYSDDDRMSKMDNILSSFGKNKNKKGTIIAAPILQAALDISFDKLYKSMESPESDVQTFGRINRWGENKEVCELNMLDLITNDNCERASVNNRYDFQLAKEWIQFFRENSIGHKTLNDIYKIYNDFNHKFQVDLLDFLNSRLDKSIEKLTTFFPKQRNFEKSNSKISSKTLRNSIASYFIVVKDTDDNWCNFTFNSDKFEIESLKTNNRQYIESETIKTVVDNLEKVKYNDQYTFNYSEISKKFFNKKSKKTTRLTIEAMLKYSRNSESPLPIFTMIYDPILGLKNK